MSLADITVGGKRGLCGTALIRLARCAIHLLPQAGEVKALYLSRLRERTPRSGR